MIHIRIITADGCKLCENAKRVISEAAERAGAEIRIDELGIDSDRVKEAIDFAVEFNLDHVPSFVIGKRVFIDDMFSLEDVTDAIRVVQSQNP